MLFLLLVSLAPIGCADVTFDLRNIDEPVMLNAIPYSHSTFAVTEIEKYRGEVAYATGGAQNAVYGDRSVQTYDNDAQLKAFEAIGGHRDRAIAVDVVDIGGGGANLLLAFVELATVVVDGQVIEIDADERGGE